MEEVWSYLSWRVGLALGGPVADRRMQLLAWPPSVEDLHVTLAMLTYMEWAWETREDRRRMGVGGLVAKVKARAIGCFTSIC